MLNISISSVLFIVFFFVCSVSTDKNTAQTDEEKQRERQRNEREQKNAELEAQQIKVSWPKAKVQRYIKWIQIEPNELYSIYLFANSLPFVCGVFFVLFSRSPSLSRLCSFRHFGKCLADCSLTI